MDAVNAILCRMPAVNKRIVSDSVFIHALIESRTGKRVNLVAINTLMLNHDRLEVVR